MARSRKPATENTVQEENTMTETDTATFEPDADVDVDAAFDEEVIAEEPAEAKAPAKPKRGDLPEGHVTPIQLAKILGERGLHTDRDGNVVRDVKPQMVYSYMKNSPKDDRLEPFDIEDSNGVKRSVLKLDDALAWWERKNERAAQRKKNAAEKAKKTASKEKTGEVSEGDLSTLETTEEAE